MPIRKKAIILLVLIVVNFSSGMLWAVTVDRRFGWLAFLLPMIWAVWLSRLRCPRCSKLVYLRTREVLGVPWTYYGGKPLPDRCERCGFAFSKTKDEPL